MFLTGQEWFYHSKGVRALAPTHEALQKATMLLFGNDLKLTGYGVIAFPDGCMLNALE